MSHWLDDAVNRAVESGAFENLKGTGKPLNLGKENPFEDPSMRLANRILKEAGYTLPWIADRNDLFADIEKMRTQLRNGWRHAQRLGQGASSTTIWQTTIDTISKTIDDLNRRIRDFNLSAPTQAVQIPMLSINREIEGAQSTE
jgi:hypothetical protein